MTLRESGEKKSPIVLDMPAGERLRVWREEAGRLFVQADNGYTGYVPKEQVKLGDVKEIPMLAQTPSRAEREWKNKSVNLAWEAVYNKNPSTDSIGELPGVNVVSPTWFSIVDGEGTVKSKAVKQYVSWAHNRNMEVWGLMDNSFDPDMTTEALSTLIEDRILSSRCWLMPNNINSTESISTLKMFIPKIRIMSFSSSGR